jgi:hypothetical protein
MVDAIITSMITSSVPMGRRPVPANKYSAYFNIFTGGATFAFMFVVMAVLVGYQYLVSGSTGALIGAVVLFILGGIFFAPFWFVGVSAKKERKKLEDDVAAHLQPLSGPVKIPVWPTKATIFQNWKEASLVVENSYVTITEGDQILFQSPASKISVKTGMKGIKFKSSDGKISVLPYSVNNAYNWKARELLIIRAAEFAALFNGRLPDWVQITPVEFNMAQGGSISHGTQTMANTGNAFPSNTALSNTTPLNTGLPPAAWHPDPYGVANMRWWDGTQWTEHTS